MKFLESSNELGCCVLTNFDLNAGASSFFRGSQKPGSNVLIYITLLFPAVGTDTTWNTLKTKVAPSFPKSLWPFQSLFHPFSQTTHFRQPFLPLQSASWLELITSPL